MDAALLVYSAIKAVHDTRTVRGHRLRLDGFNQDEPGNLRPKGPIETRDGINFYAENIRNTVNHIILLSEMVHPAGHLQAGQPVHPAHNWWFSDVNNPDRADNIAKLSRAVASASMKAQQWEYDLQKVEAMLEKLEKLQFNALLDAVLFDSDDSAAVRGAGIRVFGQIFVVDPGIGRSAPSYHQ